MPIGSALNSSAGEPPSRAALRGARRVLVKAGTSVVANADGRPSLTRLGAIAEQIAELTREGVEVIFVSSGAVGMGKRHLRKQSRMKMSFNDLHHNRTDSSSVLGTSPPLSRGSGLIGSESFVSLLQLSQIENKACPQQKKKQYDSACAAAGQFEMMNLYSSLFDQCEISASQILVTQTDFQDEFRTRNLTYAVDRLLSLGIVPIINENDAVSANQGYTAADVFSDNDSLAALCARTFNAEVVLLLTDVGGVYDKPPSEKGSKLLSLYKKDSSEVAIGEKSNQGRGGMSSKIDAALAAVEPGSRCNACVVAAGSDLDTIRATLSQKYDPSFGAPRGTLFVTPGTDLEVQALKEQKAEDSAVTSSAASGGDSASDEARRMAIAARDEARKLQALPHEERRAVLYAVADALLENESSLLDANQLDLADAEKDAIDLPLIKRLKLTHEKLSTLAAGIRQIADAPDPLGVVKSKRELADGLVLDLITVPIGVLMIIFESRPDSMPQISALALASGNGLLLKGGKEAFRSNAALHSVIGDAVEKGSGGKIKRDIIALVTSRGQVADMLGLDDVIDLVIPRGSNALVSYIKSNTRIPVLGHADGVCHVYVDSTAKGDDAAKLIVDAKTDYPSACNAVETVLLHEETLNNGVAMKVLMALRLAGVKCLGGPRAMKSGLCDVPAEKLKCEYGDLTCMIEVVTNMDEAIDWIHRHGSGHTESIVCSEDCDAGEEFLRRVDAACVFKNASTRFADGYRFGLGAEVGISTGRIHSRGPVGVEGLLTTKWQLRSSKGIHYVGEYGGENPTKTYTHKDLM
eukprot:CAMPEP_0113584190 /NCGR_PEP_ID=MMETSP0015_2-20120614/32963_1 /TAXON_ID=2838 /ORGANISM="Odontella" /LENGTH=806 /DNA_ID=CAMNT_0000489207 /DNA_START=243 /DNA_END=2663 /DNA_ORIENTATION=+ /assembly_acc=CAM_ASM_000160